MCGITGGVGVAADIVSKAVLALSHRGPDAHGIETHGDVCLGHTRLSIIDLGHRSDQPMTYRNTVISFNGEIWNYRALRAELGGPWRTESDSEVLAAALDRWGPEALPRLQGMFAVAWTSDDGVTLHLARDRFGEVPLHVARQRPFLFASEKKGLLAMGANPGSIGDVGPGTLLTVTRTSSAETRWYDPPAEPIPTTLADAAMQLRADVAAGTRERTIADVPVAVLISGGIDSSVIALHAKEVFPDLVAFTAVMDPRSRDLRCARLVADHLSIPLVEVSVSEPTAADLSSVIWAIEQHSKAQIEIGWPCLALARAVRESGARVILSGEGSDELWASYGFAYYGVKEHGWHGYRKRLFLDQAGRNFPRVNKSFMVYGVEPRLPFLNTSLVEHALALPENAVRCGNARPKGILQEAYRRLLPDEILDRPKMAFQDGVGMKTAAARVVADVRRYYRSEHRRFFGS